MIQVKDKAGQTVYVSYVQDCEDNQDGFYCETYSDPNGDNKIDDFVVRSTDIYDYAGMEYPKIIEELEKVIKQKYQDVVLDLDYKF